MQTYTVGQEVVITGNTDLQRFGPHGYAIGSKCTLLWKVKKELWELKGPAADGAYDIQQTVSTEDFSPIESTDLGPDGEGGTIMPFESVAGDENEIRSRYKSQQP